MRREANLLHFHSRVQLRYLYACNFVSYRTKPVPTAKMRQPGTHNKRQQASGKYSLHKKAVVEKRCMRLLCLQYQRHACSSLLFNLVDDVDMGTLKTSTRKISIQIDTLSDLDFEIKSLFSDKILKMQSVSRYAAVLCTMLFIEMTHKRFAK